MDVFADMKSFLLIERIRKSLRKKGFFVYSQQVVKAVEIC